MKRVFYYVSAVCFGVLLGLFLHGWAHEREIEAALAEVDEILRDAN